LRMVIAELDRDLFTLCLTIKRKSYEKDFYPCSIGIIHL